MSELGVAMCILIKTFEKFASEDGNKDTLNKAEAKKLLLAELPGLLQGASQPEQVEEILNVLDENKDSQIDLEEFLRLVCALTCTCHRSRPKGAGRPQPVPVRTPEQEAGRRQ